MGGGGYYPQGQYYPSNGYYPHHQQYYPGNDYYPHQQYYPGNNYYPNQQFYPGNYYPDQHITTGSQASSSHSSSSQMTDIHPHYPNQYYPHTGGMYPNQYYPGMFRSGENPTDAKVEGRFHRNFLIKWFYFSNISKQF